MLFIADKTYSVKIIPIASHFVLNIRTYRVTVALGSVFFRKNKNLVVDYAVILNECLRINVVDIIFFCTELFKINRFAAVNGFAELHEVKEQLVALKPVIRIVAQFFKLFFEHTDILVFTFFIKLENLLLSCFGSLAFLLLGCASCHFNKYLFRFSECLNNISDYIESAVNGSANCI